MSTKRPILKILFIHFQGRIVGGRETKKNEFPLVGALVRVMPGELPEAFCGATILTQYHALTAAHCTPEEVEEFMDYLNLLVGAHDLNNVGEY